MIKFVLLLLLVATLATLPVWSFETAVMPQLSGLKQTYQNADAFADQALQK